MHVPIVVPAYQMDLAMNTAWWFALFTVGNLTEKEIAARYRLLEKTIHKLQHQG
jgi:hypothetical protein